MNNYNVYIVFINNIAIILKTLLEKILDPPLPGKYLALILALVYQVEIAQ